MTSIRQLMANRANARKSTGPKTPEGKARASRNALRHGCESPALWDGGYTPEVEALACTLAGIDANGERLARACRIAAAQLDLVRVRQVKRGLQTAANFGFASDDYERTDRKSPNWTLLAPISRIERYEQRALARRQLAIRDFQALALEDAAKNFCGTKPMGESAMNSVKSSITDAKV